MKLSREYLCDGKPVAVSAEWLEADRWRVRVGDQTFEYHAVALGDGGVWLAPVGQEFDRSFVAYGAPAGKEYMVRVNGRTHTLASPATRQSTPWTGAVSRVTSVHEQTV